MDMKTISGQRFSGCCLRAQIIAGNGMKNSARLEDYEFGMLRTALIVNHISFQGACARGGVIIENILAVNEENIEHCRALNSRAGR